MATSGFRDVKLTLSVQTLGEENVTKLQTAVQQLAKQGGDAAPEFQRLADELGRLGDQSKALSTFKELAEDTETLRAKQEEVSLTSQQMATRLEELRTATAVAKAEQQQSTAAFIAGQVAVVESTTAIRLLKTEYDNTGKQTAAYRARLSELVAEQGAARTALVTLRAEQLQASQAATTAEAAQSKLETAYGRVAKQAQAVSAALTSQEQALRDSVSAAEALGVSTENIATSEAELVATFNRGITAIEAQAQAQRESTATAQAQTTATKDQEAAQTSFIASLNAEIKFRQQQQVLQAAAAAASETEAASQRESVAALDALAAASRRQLAAADEMAESDRLLAIQQQTLNRLRREGEDALEAERAAMQEAINISNVYEAEKRDQALAEKGAADAARAAALVIENAFTTIGVRSAEELTAEIAQIRVAMETLRTTAGVTGSALSSAFTAGQSKIKALEAEMRQLNGTMTAGDRIAGLFKNSLGQIAAGNVIADGVGYLVNKVKELGLAFVTTIAQTEQTRRALNAIYKDSNTTAAQFDFLRATAVEAGVAVGGIEKSFIKFSASMNSANIPLEQSNALFSALTKAGGTLGLTSDDIAGSLEALSQMAGKGTVSLEELRQQLGDRLPGAMSLVSKGLGLTDAQLIKLVETGGLAARDLFPALTKALGSMAGETTGLTATFENFKTVLSGVATDAGDSGWAVILNAVLKATVVTVGGAALALSTLWEGMALVGSGAAALYGVLSGDSAKTAWAFFNDQIEKSNIRLEKQALRLGATIEPAGEAAAKLKLLAAQQNATSTSSNAVAEAVKAIGDVTVTTTAGQQALTTATTLAGQGAQLAAQGYVAFRVNLDQAIASQAKMIESQAKNIKTAEQEGATLIALSQIRGNDKAVLDAQVQAVEMHVAAVQKSVIAHQTETDLLNVEKAVLIETANARGLTKIQLDNEVQALDLKIIKSQAETDQATATLGNLKLQVLTRQTLTQAYGDQSARVDEYRLTLDAARIVQESTNRAEQAGVATKAQLRAANEFVAVSQAKYNDALGNAAAKTQAVAVVEQAKINVQAAGLGVQQQAYEQLAQAATASGRYADALYYEIEAKRVRIQITQLTTAAQLKEAEAARIAAEIDLVRLEQTDAGNKVKRLEIEARLLNAKAKLIEAGAGDTIVRALNAEIEALNTKFRVDQAARDSQSALTGTVDNDTAARFRNVDSINAQTAALSKQKATSDGFKANQDSSAAGTFTTSITAQNLTALMAKRDAGRLTAADLDQAKAAQTEAANNAEQLYAMSRQSPGSVSSAATSQASNWQLAARQILDTVQGMVTFGEKTTPKAMTTAPATATGSTSHVVTVNVGGKSTSINAASAADATALANVLKSLENASATAS